MLMLDNFLPNPCRVRREALARTPENENSMPKLQPCPALPKRNYAGAEKPMHNGSWRWGTWNYSLRRPLQVAPPVELPRKPTHAQIRLLEDAIRATGETIDFDPLTHHHFADGLYGRELRIPAGTVLTGKTHRGRHLNILAQGDITVWTEEGMKRIQAPAVIVSEPGTKRVGYAHTDVVWITVHASQKTDLAALEDELTFPEPELGHEKQLIGEEA